MGYFLIVEYKGQVDKIKDMLIEKLAKRKCEGSGYCFLDEYRDLSFEFATKRGAENAMKRVRTSRKRIKCHIWNNNGNQWKRFRCFIYKSEE